MKALAEYEVVSEGVTATVVVADYENDYVLNYELRHTKIKEPTRVALTFLKEKIIESVNIKISEIMDPRESDKIRAKIAARARELIKRELGGMSAEEENTLVGRLLMEMLGLGELELILADENLEEVVVNSAREPVWVYHKKFGWLKTNVGLINEEQIHNYASIIGRKAGRQITNLEPLMDAHLLSGDRVNATLFPISTKGNSITIRKFAKDPWTIVSLIGNNTLSSEAAALFWASMQYEMNILVGGGTASGKTSFLNSILIFTPPNQRLVSIEDSVAGDSVISFMQDGEWRTSTVANLVSSQLARNMTVLPDGSQVAINDQSIKVFSMDASGRIGITEPSCFISHLTDKPLYRVETAGGKLIEVTADHSLFTKDASGAIVPIRTSGLSVGSIIAVAPTGAAAGAQAGGGMQMMLLAQERELVEWDSVVSIAEQPHKPNFVYDLSVPGNESFLVNGIVAHNTRELQLPDFLHWTPMSTRQPNPEGKGGVEMLDLMVNSLRMRPDRIVLGEIRRQREAEVLFEAMHTGHSVYSTLHADDSAQVRNRLISPPIALPESMLSALHLIAVQYRQRRKGVRRTFEIAEFMPTEDGVSMNVVYKWDARTDKLMKVGESMRFVNDLTLHTGMTGKEINDDLSDKQAILDSMVRKGITKVGDVGRVVARYYRDPQFVTKLAHEDELVKLLYDQG